MNTQRFDSIATGGGGSPQLVYPISDVTAGGWTPTPVWDELNDPIAPDTHPITRSFFGADATVNIGTASDPGVDTGHVLRARLKLNAGDSVEVQLWQGGTQVCTVGPATTGSLELYTHALSEAEAANITNYSTLTAIVHSTGGPGPSAQVSLIEFEVPAP